MKGKPINYKRFLLSTSSYAFTTEYPSEVQGGSYHGSEGLDNVTAVIENGDGESFAKYDSLYAEYYPLGDSWENIAFNAKSLTEEGVSPQDKFVHLFSKLFIDLSKLDSYKLSGLDIKVYNIQKDYLSFANNYEALANKGGSNEANFYDENGKLLPDYIYNKVAPVEIHDMLAFDKQLFEKGVASSPSHVELAVNFDPKFSGTIIGYQPGDMLRIDICITECEPNYDQLPSLFQWPGNDNLFESVKNTLQDMCPVGRVIYSYIIRSAN